MAKKVFGNSLDTNPIKFLLNQILDMNPVKIKVLNNEIIDKPYKDKKFEVDLLVEVDDGSIVGVEINTDITQKITNRNLFYMCRIMSRDLDPDENYDKLNKHIQISFDFNGKQERPIMSYKLINNETGKILSDKMEIIKISVPYFYSICYNKEATLKERFIGFFNEEDGQKAKLLIRGDKNMEELYDKVNEYSDGEIIGLYNIESHKREIEKSVREEAIEEATKEGLEAGMKQGIEQGIEQTAINMLNKNLDIKIISDVTGLSESKLQSLKKSQ